MSWWLLFDFFLWSSSNFIPCFFLVGFVRTKKLDLFAVLSFFVLYDLWIYQTYGQITLLLLLLNLLKKYLPLKPNSLLKFNIIVLFFFLGLMLLNHLSFLFLFEKKVIMTILFLNLFNFFMNNA